MDAVEYVKALHRLCKSQGQNCYFGHALGCPLLNKEDKKDGYCIANISGCEEKAVQIVEQWAKDNPIKTRQSEFLRMFPNAQRGNGVVDICPMNFDRSFECSYKNDYYTCVDCKRTYWLTEVTDND